MQAQDWYRDGGLLTFRALGTSPASPWSPLTRLPGTGQQAKPRENTAPRPEVSVLPKELPGGTYFSLKKIQTHAEGERGTEKRFQGKTHALKPTFQLSCHIPGIQALVFT